MSKRGKGTGFDRYPNAILATKYYLVAKEGNLFLASTNHRKDNTILDSDQNKEKITRFMDCCWD
jgi:hypothetical protein